MAFISGRLDLGTSIVNGAVVPPTAASGYLGGYAYQAISYDLVAGGMTLNTASAIFGPVSGNWGTLAVFSVSDILGNVAWVGTLTTPFVPSQNQYVIAGAGMIPIIVGTQLPLVTGGWLFPSSPVGLSPGAYWLNLSEGGALCIVEDVNTIVAYGVAPFLPTTQPSVPCLMWDNGDACMLSAGSTNLPTSPTGLASGKAWNNGGVIMLTSNPGLPTSPSGQPAGTLWYNGGVLCVV